MRIIELLAENYKRLRVVEITPKDRVIKITGKNGQGKTSVLDAIHAAIIGAKAIAEKPVRKGADKAKIRLDLGEGEKAEYILTRTIKTNGEHTLTIENAKGTKVASPQAMLDTLLGELSFDPLEFVGLKPKQQVEMLRKVAKLEIDVDALNAATKEDFEARREINRQVEDLRSQVSNITVQDGLPKEKQDEAAVLKEIEAASATNNRAQEEFKIKEELRASIAVAIRARDDNDAAVTAGNKQISDIEGQIRNLQTQAEKIQAALDKHLSEGAKLRDAVAAADKAFSAFKVSEAVNIVSLTSKWQEIQVVNREIDKRTRKSNLEGQLKEKERASANLTRAMEEREEQKRTAIQSAAMPVEGLSFDENQVMFNAIPLEQLGEGEQIRISTAIAMAANPTLRVIRILNGEALDDDNLKIIAEMAEKNDFQIWMAKVDSSGKCGIVMEDGSVKAQE